jgi:type II secretory pathway pseudopilin PulG
MLLESLVALAIVMIGLTAMFQGSGIALRSARTSTRHEQAASLARSYLALEGTAPLTGDRSGDAGGGFHWHASVRPVDAVRALPAGAPSAAAKDAPVVTLYRVTVRISWEDGAGGGTEQIETRRLGVSHDSN